MPVQKHIPVEWMDTDNFHTTVYTVTNRLYDKYTLYYNMDSYGTGTNNTKFIDVSDFDHKTFYIYALNWTTAVPPLEYSVWLSDLKPIENINYDLDRDGSVTLADIGVVVTKWGPVNPSDEVSVQADFDGDGYVKDEELDMIYSKYWGRNTTMAANSYPIGGATYTNNSYSVPDSPNTLVPAVNYQVHREFVSWTSRSKYATLVVACNSGTPVAGVDYNWKIRASFSGS